MKDEINVERDGRSLATGTTVVLTDEQKRQASERGKRNSNRNRKTPVFCRGCDTVMSHGKYLKHVRDRTCKGNGAGG